MVIPSLFARSRAANNGVRRTRLAAAAEKEKRALARANKVPAPHRDMQLSILKRIVVMLKERREEMKESGKKGRGLIKILVEEHLPHFPWLTRNMVHHFITTHTDENMVPTVIKTSHQTVVSGLTDLQSPVSAARARRSPPAVAAPVVTTPAVTTPAATTQLVVATEPVITTDNAANTEVTSRASTNTEDTSNKGGRPQGSTNSAKKTIQSILADALDECVMEVACLKSLAKEKAQKEGRECHVPRGAFDKTIKKVCQK